MNVLSIQTRVVYEIVLVQLVDMPVRENVVRVFLAPSMVHITIVPLNIVARMMIHSQQVAKTARVADLFHFNSCCQ